MTSDTRHLMVRQSLVTRLLVWFGLAGTATFLVLGSLALWNDYSRLRLAAHAQASASIEASLRPLALAAWNLDDQQLQLYLRPLVQSGSVVAAEVRDALGKTMAVTQRAQGPQGSESAESVQAIPLIVPGREQRVGDLVVHHSLAPIRAELMSIALHSLAAEMTKLLIIGAGIYFLLNRLVLRRLRALAAQVKALAPEDQSTRLHDTSSPSGPMDEIGTLVAATNQLLDNRKALAEAEDLRRRAEAESQAKSQFVSRMSHELRTPLNAILGFAQAIDIDGAFADERYRRKLQRIIRSGWHLSSLIGDVLDLSRVESGSVKVALGCVDLEQSWSECLDIIEQEAAAACIRLDLAVDAQARSVMADPIRLRQILVNLLSNGIKYNRLGGRVMLTARPVGTADVEISVEDTGIGMSEQQLAGLYEPFNRLGRELSSTPGTGIGLIITKGLVELMHGTLSVRSRESVGTTVTLRLPRGKPLSAVMPHLGHLRFTAAPAVVLYVEDDPVNVEIMRALLAQLPGIELAIAKTLHDGLEQVQALKPAAALVDMQLPDGTGLDFLRALRTLPGAQHVQVAVVSADSQGEAVSQALSEGASTFIGKPLEFKSTLLQIQAMLSPASASASASIRSDTQ